jgi:hypothetical protein
MSCSNLLRIGENSSIVGYGMIGSCLSVRSFGRFGSAVSVTSKVLVSGHMSIL